MDRDDHMNGHRGDSGPPDRHSQSQTNGETDTATLPVPERAETADDVYDDVPFSGIVWRKDDGELARIAIIPHAAPVRFSHFIQDNEGAHGTLLIRLHSAGNVQVEAGNPEGFIPSKRYDDRELKERYVEQGMERGRRAGREEARRELQSELQDARLHAEKLESRLGIAEERRNDAQQRAERLAQDLDRVMHENRNRIRALDEQNQKHIDRLREDHERQIDALKEKAKEAVEETMRYRETLLEMRHSKGEKGFFDSLGEHLGPELPNIIKIAAAQFAQRANQEGRALPARATGNGDAGERQAHNRSVIQRDTRRRLRRIPNRDAAATASSPSRPNVAPIRKDVPAGGSGEQGKKRMADTLPDIFGAPSGPDARPEAAKAPPGGSVSRSQPSSASTGEPSINGDGLPDDVGPIEPATNPSVDRDRGIESRDNGAIEMPSNKGPKRTAGDQIPDMDKPAFKEKLLSDLLEAAVWVARGHNSIDWLESRVEETIDKVQGLTASAAGATKWDVEKADWATLAVDLMRATSDEPAKDVGAVVAVCVRYALGRTWKLMLSAAGAETSADMILSTSNRTATDADVKRAVDVINTL